MEEGSRGLEDGCYLGLDFSTQQVRVRVSQLQSSLVTVIHCVSGWEWSLKHSQNQLNNVVFIQIKAIVINDSLEVTAETHVHFDSMLPEYRTSGGVHAGEGGRVTAPTIMWVHALDMLMDKLRVAGVEFSSVRGISGAGQQHGSVYWRRGAGLTLGACQPDKFLHTQLSSTAPVWKSEPMRW